VEPFLSQSVAIVTGAGRGLGAAAGRLLAAAGAATALVARGAGDIERIATEIIAEGGRALALPADIGDPDAAAKLVEDTVAAFGRIDFLINIAGTVTGIGKPGWELTAQELRDLVGTNLAGPMFLCRAAVPVMLRQRAGRILLLTSSAAEMPVSGASAYGASKAGLNQFIRALAGELAGSGVLVNAFNPGPVATPTLETVQQQLQPGRGGLWSRFARSPEQAAQIVLWLCSSAMADVTGQLFDWRNPATQAGVNAFTQNRHR
jgi:NAD(P)-dependent dehydrogenase (short-subunit alcohol dehydrogenase family)